MTRFRSLFAVPLVVSLLAGPPAFSEESRRSEEEWPPRYENPLMTLLFLPVKVLLGATSGLRKDRPERETDEAAGDDDS